MSSEKIDRTDLQILEVLQSHGRTKRNELAEKVDLSIPAISERLRKLEQAGIIQSYNAVLDANKLGLEITAFVFVFCGSSIHYPQIVSHASANPEILECHAITGEGSHVLKIRTQNTSTLEWLLSEIQSWPGVTNTRTSIVLSTPKETTVIPLQHLKHD